MPFPRVIALAAALLFVPTTGCGVAFGSRGEAGRAESAFQQTDGGASQVAPMEAGAVSNAATSAVPTNDETYASTMVPPDESTIAPPTSEVDVSPIAAMPTSRLLFCTAVTETVDAMVSSYPEGRAPTRAEFLRMVNVVHSEVERLVAMGSGTEAGGSGEDALAASRRVQASIGAGANDTVLANVIVSSKDVVARYLVTAESECDAEGNGTNTDVFYQVPDRETVVAILAS